MGAKLVDIAAYIQAGIDPKTKLPDRFLNRKKQCDLKNDVKKLMRVIDEQDAINRFKWYNLPDGLDGQLLERILYYKGQGAFFYMETDNTFYFLPYALDGTIDVYGRFTSVTPLPFNGGTTHNGKEKPWIIGLSKKPVYSIKLDELKPETILDSCVLLKDYSQQYSETVIPRQMLNDPLLETMSECIPFMRTALISGTGIKGMRVDDADQQNNVTEASEAIVDAALTADMFVPIVAPVELQELTPNPVSKSEEYMLALQSLDNFRLSTYGLENGGLFQKKQQMLQAEQAMNGGNVGLVFQDSLTRRQRFCDIVNSIWGLGIWCEPSENITQIDENLDGVTYDIPDDMGGGYNDNNNSGSENSTVRD